MLLTAVLNFLEEITISEFERDHFLERVVVLIQ